MLHNRFPIEEQMDTGPKQKKQNPDYKAQAANALYRMEDGTIYQPSQHIIAMLTEAGKKQKQGRSTLSSLYASGAIVITPFSIPHENQSWQIDSRPVVVRATKGRIVRHRPHLPEWALEFDIEFDEEDFKPETVNEALVYGGRRIGIGDYRPQNKGPFGRFIVVKFEKVGK